MKISIELTLIPLQNDYETHIKAFIKRLRSSDFKILENPLSTQIYGEYHDVMQFLTSAIDECFNGLDAGVINMKIVKSDRSDYEPDF